MGQRSTFREKAGDVCWQRQLRDQYNHEGTPPVPHLELKRSVVKPVSRAAAEQIIMRYEWLGTMSPTSLHFGLFFGDYCAGVSCVSYGAAMAGIHHADQFRIPKAELMTLARGACVHWAPPGSNSRLVAWTCRLLSRAKLGKLIWATADTDAGEIGTIYQAAGWTYIGKSFNRGKEQEIVSPHGRAYNCRSVGGWGKTRGLKYTEMRDLLLAAGWRNQHSNLKHRYVYVLDRSDKALVRRIEHKRLPYPKRAKHSDDASGFRPGEGGAMPTRALHSTEATA